MVEKGEASSGAYVADLPGCIAVGESRAEAMQVIREVIEFRLDRLRDVDHPALPPSSSVELVKGAT
jgi:predicted RNase H-like HicB family nuclease